MIAVLAVVVALEIVVVLAIVVAAAAFVQTAPFAAGLATAAAVTDVNTNIRADIDGLNNFNPATDTVVNVTTVNEVEHVSTGAILATSFAADAIDADAIKADAITEIQSGLATSTAQTTAQSDLDILTGSTGANLDDAAITAIFNKDISAYSGAGYAGTYLKTLYADWLNGGRLDLILDAALADTNELQVDWANGGRLDLILDATANENSLSDVNDTIIAAIADANSVTNTKLDAIPTKPGKPNM